MEVVIAMGLGVYLLLQSSSVLNLINKNEKQQISEMEGLMERLFMERVLLRDLKLSTLSQGTLISKDDDGKDFFQLDLIPCRIECSRTITLAPGKSDEVFFIVKDESAGEKRFYEPSQAYSEPDTSSGYTIDFESMNKDDILGRDPSNDELINSPWVAGQLVMIYSPEFRGTPPRRHFIIGTVTGNLKTINIDNLDGKVSFQHSILPSFVPGDLDQFLRTVPMTPGLKTFINIEPIKLVRYRLSTDQVSTNDGSSTSGAKLYRAIYDEAGGFKDRLIGTNVGKAVFSRQSTSSAVIYFEIKDSED